MSNTVYYCPSGELQLSHYYAELNYVQLKLERFNVQIDMEKDLTTFYCDDWYKQFPRLMSYDEIFRYHQFWVLA